MYAFLTFLIVIACILVVLVVLVQNPKGGGLSATFGASSSQYFGVQRTTDFLEKATWTLAIVIFIISMSMNIFQINKEDAIGPGNTGAETSIPVQTPVEEGNENLFLNPEETEENQ